MYCFDSFHIDPRSGELRKNGVKIKLQDQPFQVLALLVARAGELISRDELRQKLWPADTFVDFENGLNIAVRKVRQALGDDAESPRFIETLPRRGYRFISPVTVQVPARPPIDSIAVLPFQNLSGDQSQEYFSDGMTEELIMNLARIGSLRVVSRTSAMLYKGSTKTVPEIGRELKVDALIEGSVLRSGNRVRITAQLVRAEEDAHLWTASYDEDDVDLLDMQRQVARAIVDEIDVTLRPHERRRLASAPPLDPRAYEAYLKGRYHAHKLTADGLNRGLEYFQQAAALCPTYAPIHAGISYYYLAQLEWALSPAQAIPAARQAAERAIELDSGLAEAHMYLGVVRFWHDWDWTAAEREFRRAIELSPSDAASHQYYSMCLAWMGRGEEAIREGKRAVALDPVSVEAARILADDYYFSHDYAAAIAHLREALVMEPRYWFARLSLGRAYLQAGRTAEAIAEFELATRLEPGIADPLSALGAAYATAGHERKARKVLKELESRSRTHYVPSYNMAIVCAGLGDYDTAFAWLERALEERSMFLTWLRTDPVLDTLRDHPKFAELQRRIGLS